MCVMCDVCVSVQVKCDDINHDVVTCAKAFDDALQNEKRNKI